MDLITEILVRWAFSKDLSEKYSYDLNPKNYLKIKYERLKVYSHYLLWLFTGLFYNIQQILFNTLKSMSFTPSQWAG